MNKLFLASLCFAFSITVSIPAFSDRDYRGQHGYRMNPYNKHLHYDHYSNRGHDYRYHGHWRSWQAWHDYRSRHPEAYRNGRYFRQDGHLMFRFCDPGSGCFFFSIGR